MRKLAATLAALVTLALAGVAAAFGARGVPPFPHIGGNWSHVEENVRIGRQFHTVILDRGRIIQAGPNQITLREPDGTITAPPIPIDYQTLVRVNGSPATSTALRRKMFAQTMRIDGGAAVRVVATSK